MEKKKNPRTLKGWQQLFPDAMRVTGTGDKFLSNAQIIYLATNGNVGKVLEDKSWGTWTSGKGTKVNINAIVSKAAGMQNKEPDAQGSVATKFNK